MNLRKIVLDAQYHTDQYLPILLLEVISIYVALYTIIPHHSPRQPFLEIFTSTNDLFLPVCTILQLRPSNFIKFLYRSIIHMFRLFALRDIRI